MDNPEIKYISHKTIDFEKWDRCLESAPNRRVYALSWFLDIVADDWDAIVAGDYEFVMPLPRRKKFGIRYVYPPVYCQQLGVFPVPPESVRKTMAACLKKHFRYISYQINASDSPKFYEGFSITTKTNLVLNLGKPYEVLSKQFTTHARRNINTAAKAGVRVEKGLAPEKFIQIKKTASAINQPDLTILEKLLIETTQKGQGKIYAAYADTGEICAATFVLADANRLYYLNAFSTEEGKKHRAMYAIVNHIIEEFAGNNFSIDFEGSIIDGIARFYKGFGATEENYSRVAYNGLPLPPFLKKQ